jgi:hypothetical protein
MNAQNANHLGTYVLDAVEARYMFTISAPFATRWVGSNPAGYRLDLEYAVSDASQPDVGPSVKTDPVKLARSWPNILARVTTIIQRQDPAAVPVELTADNLDRARRLATQADHDEHWFGMTGTVAAGMDWAMLRADGVVDFDGRVTLKDDTGLFVNAIVLGSADLVLPGEIRPLTLDQAVERLKNSKGETGLAVALRFEAAQEPEPWAAKRYRRSGAFKYRRLSRGQCLGVGVVKSFGHSACFEVDVVAFVHKDRAAGGAALADPAIVAAIAGDPAAGDPAAAGPAAGDPAPKEPSAEAESAGPGATWRGGSDK